jgi:hypothetical protein
MRRLAIPLVSAAVGGQLFFPALLAEKNNAGSKEVAGSWKNSIKGNYENKIREMSAPEKVAGCL